jgi:hypothetical protein
MPVRHAGQEAVRVDRRAGGYPAVDRGPRPEPCSLPEKTYDSPVDVNKEVSREEGR